MLKTILLAFLFDLNGSASLVDSSTVQFVEIASSVVKLSAPAAARFEPLAPAHFEYTHITFRGVSAVLPVHGVVWAPVTHVRYSVPSTRAGGAPYANEHRSLTRSETVPGIVALTQGVIFPAALAQCPDLADHDAYPTLTEAFVDYVGVEGSEAVGLLVVPSLLEGLPPLRCQVHAPASAEALAQVAGMVSGYLLPAIKAETGLR